MRNRGMEAVIRRFASFEEAEEADREFYRIVDSPRSLSKIRESSGAILRVE